MTFGEEDKVEFVTEVSVKLDRGFGGVIREKYKAVALHDVP